MTDITTYLPRVHYATDGNQHTEAIKIVAEYAAHKHNNLDGIEKLQGYCDAIETLHQFYGHMPPELDKTRNAVRKAIFSLLDETEQARFSRAM